MIVIRYEHIKTVQQNIGNGITNPKFATTDDNKNVIIKTFNGPEGPLVLFNEIFCYKLAILIGLPMPKSGICLIDNDTILYNDDVNESNFGYGFYSTFIFKTAPLVDSIINLLSNKDIFYKILLFDHIIFNSDRNPGNLLVQYYKNNIQLYVIDHSHVFINQAIWDANCLNRGIIEKDYFSTRILEDNQILYNMFFHNISITKERLSESSDIFKKQISESILQNILLDIPKELLPSKNNIDSLIKYILYRVNHIDDICNTILKYLSR